MRTATVTVVAMPRLSDSMEEGTVVQWLEVDRDLVASGDVRSGLEAPMRLLI